jgi:hypothetical protein
MNEPITIGDNSKTDLESKAEAALNFIYPRTPAPK